MLKHYLEVTPKYLKTGHVLRMIPAETGYKIAVIGKDTVVYVITEQDYKTDKYTLVEYHGKFGWINSMWLEEIV